MNESERDASKMASRHTNIVMMMICTALLLNERTTITDRSVPKANFAFDLSPKVPIDSMSISEQ
jgi:hypothetical protein